LILFGLLHHLLQPREALLLYGIVGFLLLPFLRFLIKWNFIAGILVINTASFTTEYLMILGCFIIGLAVGRIQLFTQVSKYHRSLLLITWITLVLTPFVLYIQYLTFPTSYYGTGALIVGITMATLYVTFFLLIIQRPFVQKVLQPLSYLDD
jgi:hypothetical protein